MRDEWWIDKWKKLRDSGFLIEWVEDTVGVKIKHRRK